MKGADAILPRMQDLAISALLTAPTFAQTTQQTSILEPPCGADTESLGPPARKHTNTWRLAALSASIPMAPAATRNRHKMAREAVSWRPNPTNPDRSGSFGR
jgi:hypothetical protein